MVFHHDFLGLCFIFDYLYNNSNIQNDTERCVHRRNYIRSQSVGLIDLPDRNNEYVTLDHDERTLRL